MGLGKVEGAIALIFHDELPLVFRRVIGEGDHGLGKVEGAIAVVLQNLLPFTFRRKFDALTAHTSNKILGDYHSISVKKLIAPPKT